MRVAAALAVDSLSYHGFDPAPKFFRDEIIVSPDKSMLAVTVPARTGRSSSKGSKEFSVLALRTSSERFPLLINFNVGPDPGEVPKRGDEGALAASPANLLTKIGTEDKGGDVI